MGDKISKIKKTKKMGDREEKPQNKAVRGEEKHCTDAEIVGI